MEQRGRVLDKMKIFIDGGANVGQSIRSFKKNFSDWLDYEIHSFECNPKLIPQLTEYKEYATIYENALWVKNEELIFYLNGDNKTDGGSLRSDKTTGRLKFNQPINVKAIDIIEFIKLNFKESDYIILKLDVEVAEYDIIPHLLNNNMFGSYIDELYVEFHYNKLKNISKEHHDTIVYRLNECGIHPKYWDAHRNFVEK